MRRILTAVGLLVSAGCSAPRPTANPPSTFAPTAAPPSPTAPPPTAIPTATRRACLSQPGQILVEEVFDEEMARSLPYRVYLPPCFERSAGKAYPVLILLHGLQSTDSQWDDLGVDEAADALIREGVLAPFVIVMPWERKGLDFEAAIVEKLLPHIRSEYAGEGDRVTTSIGGLSRGAGWALRIGLGHPEIFGSIGLHSPAVLPPDMYYLGDWIEAARQASVMPRLWVDSAERDTSRAGAEELAALLDGLGVGYAWSSAPGEHAVAYWSSRVGDYLRWYAEPWADRAGQPATATP